MIIAPCATPPPRSHLAYSIAQVFEPYLSSTFLFHGYRFFAPNPGPGHLLRYEAVISDSQGQVTEGVFPDLDQQWPRLLYHRYFMIAERVWSDANIMPPPASGFVNEEHHREYEEYRLGAQHRLKAVLVSIARHVRRETSATSVSLYAQEHLIPPPSEVAAGMRLNDVRLYRERLLGKLGVDGTWHWPEEIDEPVLDELP